jgi:hypothetical protein
VVTIARELGENDGKIEMKFGQARNSAIINIILRSIQLSFLSQAFPAVIMGTNLKHML